MNGHINETAPPLVPIGEVKLVQVQIVVWFVRTCEVWIPLVFVLSSLCNCLLHKRKGTCCIARISLQPCAFVTYLLYPTQSVQLTTARLACAVDDTVRRCIVSKTRLVVSYRVYIELELLTTI